MELVPIKESNSENARSSDEIRHRPPVVSFQVSETETNLNAIEKVEEDSNASSVKTVTSTLTSNPTHSLDKSSFSAHIYDRFKPSSSSSANRNPFLNIFHNYHHHNTLNPFHGNVRNSLRRQSDSMPSTLDYSSESLLQYTREGNLRIVKEILAYHAKTTKATTSGTSKLVDFDPSTNYNTISGDASTAFSSVKIKLDIEIADEGKQTPLIIASRNKHEEIARLLIENGANVNATDLDNWTPLMNAAHNGSYLLAELLISKKANIEVKDCGGFTPLIWACYKNHPTVIKLLIQNGADPNAQCKNSISALSWAAGRGNYDAVVELLKSPRITINQQDQNGSTALLWAARKGATKVVQYLVEHQGNPEIFGMNNATPLIISCKNGHPETALYLASCTIANINHLDKDGHSALTIAVKNGYTDVVLNLLDKGAYINTPNKKGDSILTTAVKGGHKPIIDALLARHVEVDAVGNIGKTALHHAIEKANLEIVRSLLAQKPDLEIASKDGDTPLLLAVKRKSTNIVNELLINGSRVSPVDKNGDNVLHISLRNRSRDITELILANPKNSKYLYKPNKDGETPYKIDASNPKSILTQIFGARQLNMTEDSILGYDLYSSALAEILSEPSLHTPITVGLYAKWGSGKSFLLAQLKTELKSFAKLTTVINLDWSIFLVLAVLILNLIVSAPVLFFQWMYGLIVFGSLMFFSFSFILFFKYFFEKREKKWAQRVCEKVSTQFSRLKLLLQVLFLNPPQTKSDKFEHKNLKFIFTEYGKISTIGGHNTLASMVASLYSKLEDQYGVAVTRLCRTCYNKGHLHSKFRRICCVPTFLILIFVISAILAVCIFFRVKGFEVTKFSTEEKVIIITLLAIVAASLFGSSFTWLRLVYNLIRSPNARIIQETYKKQKKYQNEPRSDNFVLKLKNEIDLIAYTVNTIDAFTHNCTRLVIIIDGLDSCEQSKVLQILEVVHVLFSKEGDPFISILAVDPHVLIKGIEGNLTPVFRNGSVNGNDYLKTIIHLPVYLQVDLSKARAISKQEPTFITNKKQSNAMLMSSSQDLAKIDNNADPKGAKKKKNKKRRRSSIKAMSAYDLTDQLIKSDLFLDINPRNLRRLINIIALTGRLLRAYHIDFNWRILASWIYLVEQWPYRCSWIVMYYDENEGEFDENSTLNDIYLKIKNHIPIANEPLLELDRNPRKFEQFLQNCQPPLTVVVLKKILSCTCNLDPYLIKLIKDSADAIQDRYEKSNLINLSGASNMYPMTSLQAAHMGENFQSNNQLLNNTLLNNYCSTPPINAYPSFYANTNNNSMLGFLNHSNINKLIDPENELNNATADLNWRRNRMKMADQSMSEESKGVEIDMSKHLSDMTIEDVCEAISSTIDFINDDFKELYRANLREKNINGKVLVCCDLEELKHELQMTFGDWQLFKNWILSQRAKQNYRNLKKFSQGEQNTYNSNYNTLNHGFVQSAPKFAPPVSAPTTVNKEVLKPQEADRVEVRALPVTEPPKSTPEAPKIVTSSTRKVEFYVTPVSDDPLEVAKNAQKRKQSEASVFDLFDDSKSGLDRAPRHSTLATIQSVDEHDVPVKANDKSSSSSNQDHMREVDSRARLLNKSLEVSFDDRNPEEIPLTQSKQNLDKEEHAADSALTKLSKKLFKSIDNIFHKTETSPGTSRKHGHAGHQKDKAKTRENGDDDDDDSDEINQAAKQIDELDEESGSDSDDSDEEDNDDDEQGNELDKANQNKMAKNESKSQLIKQKSTRKERFFEFIKDKSKKSPMSSSVDSNNNKEIGNNSNHGSNNAKKSQDQTAPSGPRNNNNKNEQGSENQGLVYYVFDEDDDIQ